MGKILPTCIKYYSSIVMPRSFLQHPLEYLFQTPSHLVVLRGLSQLKAGISGRELARRVEISNRNCRLILNRLHALGLVHSEGASKFHLYRLNREHRFVDLFLKPLLDAEPHFKKDLFEEISKSLVGQCLWAGIFGSVAEGTDTIESDLDLLVLLKTASQEKEVFTSLENLKSVVLEEWGIVISPLLLMASEFKSRKKISDSLRVAILTNHITLVGKDSAIK